MTPSSLRAVSNRTMTLDRFMTNIVQDDEIDLFEIAEILWRGKWQLLGAICISALCAFAFLFIKQPQFSSTIHMSERALPTHYEQGAALTKFKALFYSDAVFSEWKSEASNVTISFDSLSNEELSDGYRVLKDEENLFVVISDHSPSGARISVKTNELFIIEQYKRYSDYINQIVSDEFTATTSQYIVQFERQMTQFETIDNDFYSSFLSLSEFADYLNKGELVIAVSSPTKPKKVSLNSTTILVMAVLLGGFIGMIFVLIRNAVRTRKIAAQ